MLAQVFGSTTNQQTFYNMIQQALSQYYANLNFATQLWNPNGAPPNNAQSDSQLSRESLVQINAVFDSELEIAVPVAPAAPALVVHARYSFDWILPPDINALILAEIAAGVTAEMVFGYKQYFFLRLNGATGAVYTNAEIMAITGWTAAQVQTMFDYENYLFTHGVPDQMKSFQVTMRNTSPAAQNIRIGQNPAFAPAPVAGMLLRPGDLWLLENFNFTLNCIADGAGATLSVFALRTA